MMAVNFDNLRLDRQLCFALFAATNAITRAYNPLLERIGLTYSQYLVMLALWQHGTAPLNEISKNLHMDPDELGPSVNLLLSSGLIQTVRAFDGDLDPIVMLTESGQQLQAAAAAVQNAVVCSVGMSRGSFQALRTDLNGLIDRLNTSSTLPPLINAVDVAVGGRLAEKRVSLGLERSDLAAATAIPEDLINDYELGSSRIPAGDLLNMLRILDCSIGDFFSG